LGAANTFQYMLTYNHRGLLEITGEKRFLRLMNDIIDFTNSTAGNLPLYTL
jgi:hypothetical protein